MNRFVLLLMAALLCLSTATWAQKKPMSAKARKAKIAAASAARTKAEQTRRAEQAARIAAALPVTDGPEVAELQRITDVLAEATVRSDAETLTHLLADEYVAVGSQGLLSTKTDLLNAIANDEAKCDINKPFDVVVRVYGNTGLVMHNTSFRGVLNGVNTSGEYRTTRYFVKRNGKWLVTASHTTHVQPQRLTLVAEKLSKKAKREQKKTRGAVADRN